VPLASAFVRAGKVRDLFQLDDRRILLVASDRISAFDVVLPTVIPDKGRVLTGLSRFWFAQTASVVPNHLVATGPDALPDGFADAADDLRGRMMLCRRARVLPAEVIVRGYLSGTGWKDYVATGAICGIRLPDGLREGDRLPAPILTPSTKAVQGTHDENIDWSEFVRLLGDDVAEQVRDIAIRLYRYGCAVAEPAGIILADTKFEFGIAEDTGELLLVDELMTPDSSRFWDAATWAPGGSQPSFDKQFVRDWLLGQPWDRTAPGPALPGDVVDGTRERYVAAFERLTGASFARYLEEDVIA
jgi:phosphoribosylaminoimidazole-succinocarboxamide synthase